MLAFGGTYQWTAVPLLAGILCLAAVARPAIARPPFRMIDAALIAALCVIALQLIPLPASARLALSPGAILFDQHTRLGEPVDPLATPPRPLSLDPASTAWALAFAAGLALFFWAARATFLRGGLRIVLRGIAWLGLGVAIFGIVQHATAPTLLYWHWLPESRTARPFGPFVNRNDFACWMAMAIPLTMGYSVARIHSRRPPHGPKLAEAALDATGIWLAGSMSLMLAAVLVSLSRSGMTAAAASLLALVLITRSRIGSRGRIWLLAGLTIIVAAASAYTSFDAMAGRVEDTITLGLGGRQAIWRDTWTMIRDFWRVGVGAGAYVHGMLEYQTGPRQYFYYNHAHNEYLQLLAEGGLAVTVPVLVGVIGAVRVAARRLREDGSSVYWIRAGAASGLIGLLVESVWDTGVLMPANAVLAAILAAVALHETREVP